MAVAVAPVACTASATGSKTGSPRCCAPPLPGVTPPTIWVPYAIACSGWDVPRAPVKPWQMTLVCWSISTAMLCRLVDHAADAAVELHIVEAVLAGFDFRRVFLGFIAQCLDVGMAKKPVVVEIDFGVQRQHVARAGHDQRVDFDH